MKAWTFQDSRQKKNLGAKAPWSVGWLDPEGRRKSKRVGLKSAAVKYQRRIEGELAAGTYQHESRKQWSDFRKEFEEKIAAGMEPSTRYATLSALDTFERITRPARVSAIGTPLVDAFVAKRRTQRGLKKDSKVSPATVNKELRHVKATLRIAHEWGYLPKVPKIRMLKEPQKLVRYVTAEHFAALYNACDAAQLPRGLPYSAGVWWRSLLTFTYMTGWRIGEPLSLLRDDLDLEKGHAITRHGDNKGKRDELVPLHPVVVEHMEQLAAFDPVVFPWHHSRRRLYAEFERIHRAAGIHLPCNEKHEHTDSCYCYGFHDLRRAFATVNAETLSADALQSLMRHKSYTTTQRYINMAHQLNRSVEGLHVPDVLRAVAAN